jgi:hypothetical protein
MERTLTRFGVGIKTDAQKLVDNVIAGPLAGEASPATRKRQSARTRRYPPEIAHDR